MCSFVHLTSTLVFMLVPVSYDLVGLGRSGDVISRPHFWLVDPVLDQLDNMICLEDTVL